MKRVLLFGATGQLGFELYMRLKRDESVNLLATQSPRSKLNVGVTLDVKNSDSVRQLIRAFDPILIINCVAYTNVNGAETDHDAMLINAEFPKVLAEECALYSRHVIHFSTDYVYGDEGDRPIKEDQLPNPKNAYGLSKALGDAYLLAPGQLNIVFRTSWVYSAYGNNFLKAILHRAQKMNALSVVSDRVGSPTSTTTLVNAVMAVVAQPRSDFGGIMDVMGGLYHLTDEGYLSWYEFALAILDEAKQCGYEITVEDVTPLRDVLEIAYRSKNSRLDCSKYDKEKMFFPERPRFDEPLAIVLNQLQLF